VLLSDTYGRSAPYAHSIHIPASNDVSGVLLRDGTIKRFSGGGVEPSNQQGVDVNIVAIAGSSASAENLKNSTTTIYCGSVTGVATSTTLIDSGLTQADDNHWYGRIILFTSGTLKYQATDITGFDPATDRLTFTALTSAPGMGDTYVIV
jgi:hypothetical protein